MSETRGPMRSTAEWLPVGAASRHLGVDRDTLRRWAAAGRVEVFTTPGGHRRFSRTSLDRLTARRATERRSYATDLAPSSARITAAYRRRYVHGGSGELITAVAPSEAERESFRVSGRTLVEALVRYVDAATDDERVAAEADAGEATVAFADRLSGASIGVAEALAAFVSARRPFLSEIARISRRRSLSATEVSELYERSGELLDRLVILLAATMTADRREA
jgi:excisionase family DNA binding protein